MKKTYSWFSEMRHIFQKWGDDVIFNILQLCNEGDQTDLQINSHLKIKSNGHVEQHMPQRVTRSRMVDIRNSAVRPDAETIQEGLTESEVQRNHTIPSATVTFPAPLPVTNIVTHGIDAPHAMTGVDLNSDNPSLKDILRAIYTTHNQTSMSLKNIDGRLSELETSLEFAHAQAYKNKNSIEALQSENRSLTDKVNDLSSELNTLRSEIK